MISAKIFRICSIASLHDIVFKMYVAITFQQFPIWFQLSVDVFKCQVQLSESVEQENSNDYNKETTNVPKDVFRRHFLEFLVQYRTGNDDKCGV